MKDENSWIDNEVMVGGGSSDISEGGSMANGFTGV